MAQMQILEDGIFSMVPYTDMIQEQILHHTNGKTISLKRQNEYKERVEKSTITKCVEFFRGLLKRPSKKNTSTVSNLAKNAPIMRDMPPTINPIPLTTHIIEENILDVTMIDRLPDEDEGQELRGMTGLDNEYDMDDGYDGGFGDEYDTDDGYDGISDDMGMSEDEESSESDDDDDDEVDEVGVGDGRVIRSYQGTGTHNADNYPTDAAGFIRTPTPEYSPPDDDFEPDTREYPYLTPSPESFRKQSTTSNARNPSPRSLPMEPATPPSSPPVALSNDPHQTDDIFDSPCIDIYDPKDGLKVFWAVEEVKKRYAQHLGVETLTPRRREEVRRFGNEVLSLIVLDRIVNSVDTKFVDTLFNGYFFSCDANL